VILFPLLRPEARAAAGEESGSAET